MNPTCPNCGKACYQSPHHARLAVKAMGRSIRVYRCGGWYHVTKEMGKKRDGSRR